MGRSVSYASGSAWVLYTELPYDEGHIFTCRRCDHEHERDDDTEPDECEECGNVGFLSYERYPAELAWDDFVGNLKAAFKRAFPSLEDCDEWLDREDHAILENHHVYIGVSEYCGVVSVWCKPHPFEGDYYGSRYYERGDCSALAEHWAASIEDKARKVLARIADPLVKVGHFSNGEALYKRASA